MKGVRLEKSSRDPNKETARDGLFKNLVCCFGELKRRMKTCVRGPEGVEPGTRRGLPATGACPSSRWRGDFCLKRHTAVSSHIK